MTPQSQRRFPTVLKPKPNKVDVLSAQHPAVVNRTTLFPSRIVTADESPRLLVSGHNNRKIGKRVTRGPWAGMPIFTLSLTERATCPSYCAMLTACMGNGMQWARRHQVGPKFEARLREEVEALADRNPQGFVVRLHVLGDFYSTDYVHLWRQMLTVYPELHVYGYTARRMPTAGEEDPIGTAVAALDADFPDRCFIRFSSPAGGFMGATVIDYTPHSSRVEEGLVCPAETEAARCCADCGLCWSQALRDQAIVFVLHGPSGRGRRAA